MFIDELTKLYREEKIECWQCTDYIKHNPVLYPRVGDLFLKELFALANSERKIPYNRRKKVQMDSVWYRMDRTSYASFVIGCEIAKMIDENIDIHLQNGQRIPFFAYWYLTCLFLGEADELSTKELSTDFVAKLKKEKEQKGICKPDGRRYYKGVGLNVEHVASDFPLSKNFCPMQQEYDCDVDCPKQIEVGTKKVTKGLLSFRHKEELLYFFATQKQRLPKGVLASELLYRFLSKEYKDFYELLNSEETVCRDKDDKTFNCQMFAVFAYLSDCLSALSWIKLYILRGANQEKVSKELKKEGLWQLAESVKINTLNSDNPLLLVLAAAEILNPRNMGCKPEICDLIEIDFEGDKKYITVKIPTEISQEEAVLEYRQSLEALNPILGKKDLTILLPNT